MFWFVGGTDPDKYSKAKEAGKLGEIPTNHNPRFAPVLHPTLETGVEAIVVAARARGYRRKADSIITPRLSALIFTGRSEVRKN